MLAKFVQDLQLLAIGQYMLLAFLLLDISLDLVILIDLKAALIILCVISVFTLFLLNSLVLNFDLLFKLGDIHYFS